MVTNKKLLASWSGVFLLILTGLFLTGCTPAGPKALLDGKKFLDQGEFQQAIEKFNIATSLIPTNAQAWNYLGLAQHHANQPAKAVDSYRKALKLNPDLVIVYYNIGNLFLEQNRPDLAKNELTAFTLRQNNSAEGWTKLGAAQLRLREIPGAEKSLNEALRLNPQSPEALNNQGLVYQQKGRSQDAANYFAAALKYQPDYAPALLNLAIIYQTHLNNREFALQKYHEYLALQPRPANAEAVEAIASQLSQETAPATRLPANLAVTPGTVAPANARPQATNALRTANTLTNTPKLETPAPAVRVATGQTAKNPMPAENIVKPEVVKVQDAAELKQAQDVTQSQTSQRPVTGQTGEQQRTVQPVSGTASSPKSEKRGFFQKINPANLFKSEDKTNSVTEVTTASVKSPERATQTISYPRYPYKSSTKPSGGNRPNAERFYAQGVQAQKERRLSEAVEFYKSSVQADPSYFEAQLGLGSTAYEAGKLGLSLIAHETALAIKPDSFSTRFYFALTLKKSGYPMDAAEELERALAKSSNESNAHQAAAHLMLANLYAEQLRRPDVARTHYTKVLELDPKNSQATAVRYWLRDNP